MRTALEERLNRTARETGRERFKYIAIECGISGDIDAAIMKVRDYYSSLCKNG